MALLVAPIALWHDSDPFAQVRADASAALEELREGDLLAVGARLAAQRGNTDFAYFFTKKTSPRLLGDALGSVAGDGAGSPLKSDVDPHSYEIALTDLAGTLALASHGFGDRALPPSWRESFILATTAPDALRKDAARYQGEEMQARADQDRANKQNLLLLLSRGYWSTDFLQGTTAAFWKLDHRYKGDAWQDERIDGAQYAPAPNGAYLSDGVVALMAALTANPAASRWAFSEFQAGSKGIEGTDDSVGKFTHYLLFEHRYPKTSDGEGLGVTAVLTALSSAIEAESDIEGVATVTNYVQDLFGGGGPLHDSSVLQSLARDVKANSRCTWHPVTYWNCTKAVASAVWRWVTHWGHRILDILSFAPPPVGVVAAGSNAAWYVIEGDYADAGLSLAAAVPALAFVKVAKARKAGKLAKASKTTNSDREIRRAAAESNEVANAARQISGPARRAEDLRLAKKGAARVKKSPQDTYAKEAVGRDDLMEMMPGTVREKTLHPKCTITCEGDRRVDIYNPKTRKCIEVKKGVGTTNIRHETTQVAKDVLLRQSGICKRVEWHFLPDASGYVGPSAAHRRLLKQYRIRYVIYLPRAYR
ncbi:hypothetical protein [Aeromicrobium sp. NPDC092404]|uniref:hypothetical protein n=1 Tax=Aeromicrobium sp. NPDC092404 TaxID=3154976 RepID=UPI00341D7B16